MLRAISAILAAAIPLAAQTAVTLHNRSGHELTLCRPAGGSAAALLIRTARGGNAASRLHPATREASGASQASTFLLADGDTATLDWEGPAQELQTELLALGPAPDGGVAFHGCLVYSVAPAPGGTWAGRLDLAQGPTPATRALPQNRNVRVLSVTELEIY